ncbi:MAG: mechanosensitive ion channel [Planctomycetaceae bacterium]|nr:mechanosensitive ion channel [Planctomycetaceae bacterium]
MNIWPQLLAESENIAAEALAKIVDQQEVTNWVNDIKSFLAENAVTFGFRLLGAIAIYYVGRWVMQIMLSLVQATMLRAKVDLMIVRFTRNVLNAVLTGMIVVAALGQLGVRIDTMTAVIAAAGFAIGLALQGSLSNIASGILLVIFKPFRVGDRVDAGGTSGKVEEIHLFTTILRTPDNAQVVVPNGQVTSGVITNYSAFHQRRIDLVVGCGYADDLLAVKRFLLQLLQEHPKVLADPEPLVAVAELADSSVNFNVRPWVATADYAIVRSELLEAIKLGFDKQGFTIPFPSQDLYLQTPPALTVTSTTQKAA